MVKETNDKKKVNGNKTSGKNKIRPRAGDWGFLVRGKGKEQFQRIRDKQK